MKKLVSNLLLIAVIAFGMASCTNAQKMIDAADQINIQCNPEVLEVIAGNIDATVSVTFPPEYFLPKATLEVTPVLLSVCGIPKARCAMIAVTTSRTRAVPPSRCAATGAGVACRNLTR